MTFDKFSILCGERLRSSDFFFQFTSYFALDIQSFLLNSLFVFVLFNSLLGKQTPLAFTNNQPLDLAFLLTVLMKHAKNKYSVKTLYTFRPENYLKNAHILFLVKEIRIQCTKRKCKLMLLAAEYFKVTKVMNVYRHALLANSKSQVHDGM